MVALPELQPPKTNIYAWPCITVLCLTLFPGKHHTPGDTGYEQMYRCLPGRGHHLTPVLYSCQGARGCHLHQKLREGNDQQVVMKWNVSFFKLIYCTIESNWAKQVPCEQWGAESDESASDLKTIYTYILMSNANLIYHLSVRFDRGPLIWSWTNQQQVVTSTRSEYYAGNFARKNGNSALRKWIFSTHNMEIFAPQNAYRALNSALPSHTHLPEICPGQVSFSRYAMP